MGKVKKDTYIGHWNGTRTPFRVVNIIVGEQPKEMQEHAEKLLKGRKQYLWFVPFIGEVRQAIEVHYSNDRIFYLDNEDGSGFFKVTDGLGSPQCGHRSIYPKEVVGYVSQEEVNQFSVAKAGALEKEIDDRWTLIDPKGYSHHKEEMKTLLAALQGNNR